MRTIAGTAHNLRARARLATGALLMPWPRLCLTARKQFATGGEVIDDVVGNVDPFDLVDRIAGNYSRAQHQVVDLALARGHDYVARNRGFEEAWNAEPEVAEFMATVVFASRARHVIELGCFIGFSSCHIASALQQLGGERLLYCVDTNERHLDALKANVDAMGLSSHVRSVHGASLEPSVVEQLPQAEVIFIDSAHDYETTAQEIDVYQRKIVRPGCLVLHDAIMWPGVRRAVRELAARRFMFATSRGAGVAVVFVE
jgi:predicted O-methyltransferase YrrM